MNEKLYEIFNDWEIMILGIYSSSMEAGQSMESLDEMDFMYFIDLLIYRKYTDKKGKKEEVYIDNISL